jgi:hypothetical protein
VVGVTSSRWPVSPAPLIKSGSGSGYAHGGSGGGEGGGGACLQKAKCVLLVMQVRVRMGVGYGERQYFEGLPPCAIPLILPILLPGITIARGLPVPVHVRDAQRRRGSPEPLLIFVLAGPHLRCSPKKGGGGADSEGCERDRE